MALREGASLGEMPHCGPVGALQFLVDGSQLQGAVPAAPRVRRGTDIERADLRSQSSETMGQSRSGEPDSKDDVGEPVLRAEPREEPWHIFWFVCVPSGYGTDIERNTEGSGGKDGEGNSRGERGVNER